VKTVPRIISKLALGAAALAAFAAPASASSITPFGHGGHVVFAQTDGLSGNAIVAYDRAPDGTLHQAGTYPTGGLGGQLTGSVTDHIASQDSLVYDKRHGLLYALNPGSNSVTVFVVRGDRLFRTQTISSGGSFPVSIALHDNLVYVANARNGGSVQGFRVLFDFLLPIYGSSRPLGLDTTLAPEFVSTPGQATFSPDGSQLLVSTKQNGFNVDVFNVYRDGRLSASPVANTFAGLLPFAMTFDRHGNLVLTEAAGFLVTASLGWNGVLTQISSAADGQAATCWVVEANGFFYASNTGSNSISVFSETPGGVLANTGTVPTDAGTTDMAVSPDQRYLYAQTGIGGIIDEFRTNADGSLTSIGSVTLPDGLGADGLVAL
jgi:hypothetical protein